MDSQQGATKPRVGIVFPHAEIGTDPVMARDFVQAADALGYSHIHIYDHVLGGNPAHVEAGRYSANTPFHEPFALGGFIAAATALIEIVTGVLVLPQRQTALVAKQAAEVDLLSNGRLILGVGTGWNELEYESLGVPFRDRGARLDEQVEVLRALWNEGTVTFDGKFHQLDDVGINPRPRRQIPIWFGGQAGRAVTRAARIGDGWFPLLAPGEELRRQIDDVREQVEAGGRDPEGFSVCGYANYEGGTPDKWIRQRDKWGQVGATHISVRTTPPVLPGARPGVSAKYHMEAMEEYAEAVFSK